MSKLDLTDRKRLRRLVTESASATRAIVLIGSYARGAAVRPISDLDVLIVAEDVPYLGTGIDVVAIAPCRLRERALSGDDFVQWALRFGVPLSGRSWWLALNRELSPRVPWPDAERKFELASRRLNVIDDLVAMGDGEAAQYELRFAFSLIARGLLLDAGLFPLSRPELPDQLDSVGHGWWARNLHQLGEPPPIAGPRLTEIVRAARRVVGERDRHGRTATGG